MGEARVEGTHTDADFVLHNGASCGNWCCAFDAQRRQAAGSSLEDARSACFVVDGTMADPR